MCKSDSTSSTGFASQLVRSLRDRCHIHRGPGAHLVCASAGGSADLAHQESYQLTVRDALGALVHADLGIFEMTVALASPLLEALVWSTP